MPSTAGDVDAGIGVTVLINGMCSPGEIADFALRTVVAAVSGEALPDPPEAPALEPDDFVGIYRGATVDVAIEANEGRLILIAGDERIPLEPVSSSHFPDAFLTDHPAFSRFL
jgi:hypothetical protein